MLKWLVRAVVVLVVIVAAGAAALRLTNGGGRPYPGVAAGAPTVAADRITTPISVPYPPGMVASAPDGRIFYTYHMLHKPERFVDATVFEWVNGAGVPFPNLAMQAEFRGAMGITIDRQGRLWVIKPGALEGRQTQLLAIDIATGEKVLDYSFLRGEAGFAQDMRVSPDGQTVYLADTGLFRFTPASLIVFDVQTQRARTLLRGHPSVSAQDWIIRKTSGASYTLALGLITFMAGADGIALTADGQWLYYAAMSHDSLYRIPTAALLNPALSDAEVASQIAFVGHKPMSDGIELLADNTVIITDVENGGLVALSPEGVLTRLTASPAVNWTDSVTVAPDGALWFTDSRLTDLIDQFATPSDQARMLERGPYAIYRVAPEAPPVPAP
jgi:sugar lactone lactonase YvrE